MRMKGMKFTFLVIALSALFACTGGVKETKNSEENPKSPVVEKSEVDDVVISTVSHVGDVAPDFSVTTLNGDVIKLSDLKGKTVFVNFFAIACPMCIKEFPVLQKSVWRKYKDNKDFVLVSVGRGHSAEELKKFVTDRELEFPMAADTDKSVYNLYASKYIPRNVIINKDGKIICHKTGFSKSEFKELVKILDKELN
jgi:peroxiredoxin